MKKITLLFVLMNVSLAFSQNQSNLEQSEKIKSGNYKDIFYTFLQVASENLSTESKSLEFNSTIFAVKSELNPELLLDRNFVKEKFLLCLFLQFQKYQTTDCYCPKWNYLQSR